ncbi:MAG: MFS transporter [Sphingomonadaceae bacterium]
MAEYGLLTPLRERDFARLWLGQMASNVGDWVNYVALTALVWDLTGSAWMVAVLRACHAVPLLLLGPFSGVFVDRWNRKTTLVIVDLLRAGLVLLLPFVQDIGTILAVTLAFNVASTFFAPAKNALIPNIVSRDRLLAANSLSSTTQNMAMVIGPALGGAILAYGGTAAAFYFDSATFVFSAIAIAAMAASGALRQGSGEERDTRQELLEGLRFATSHLGVRTALLLEVGLMAGWGSINVLAIVIAEKVLSGGATEYGLLLTAVGFGSVVGALLTGGAGSRLGLVRFFPLGFVIVGTAIAGLAGSRVLVAAAAGYFFAGVGRMAIEVAATTMYQRAVPDGLRGRIFSLRHMVTHLAVLVANQAAGLFTDAASVGPILAVAAVVQLACGLLSGLFLARGWGKAAKEVD